MSDIKCQFSEEEREAIINAFKILTEAFERMCNEIKKVLEKVADNFREFISKIEPKTRYKILKKIGVTDYLPYFRREGVYHCRNNC